MGKLGYGYGSEFHLLRWLGRHRDEFSKRVLSAIKEPQTRVSWLDFKFTDKGHDAEWKGIDFITEEPGLKKDWESFWPGKKGIHNWDAIGSAETSNGKEWLLIEAKAHANEILSDCKATDPTSIRVITESLKETQAGLGVDLTLDWTKGCYQFTNRLAILWFLHKHRIPAHLVFVYFTGDSRPLRRNAARKVDCPADEDEWEVHLKKQDLLVGLPANHVLSGRIHKLFIPVVLPASKEDGR